MTRTCECGCGQTPPPAAKTRIDRGEVKGEPRRFVPGHHPAHHKAPAARRPGTVPKLTRESLERAIQPPNNCQVARFRESLDDESLALFDEAVGYDKADLPAPQLRDWLIRAGFAEDTVPTVEHITAHRQTRRPCRCRG